MNNPNPLVESPTQLSHFAKVRTQAKYIWRGPQSVEIYRDKKPAFYGWSNLELEKTPARKDIVECRCVYANLFDDSQETAILRAVYWDGVSTKQLVKEQKEAFNLVLPVRFVTISAVEVRNWLNLLGEMSVSVMEPLGKNPSEVIRRLRIEQDYKAAIFEKIWQTKDSLHITLNEVWDLIWTQMTQHLGKEEIIPGLYENFQPFSVNTYYDLQNYQPDKLT